MREERMPVDPSILTPLCKRCRQALIVSNVETNGGIKHWVHDRDPRPWGGPLDDRRHCVPYLVRLRLSGRQLQHAEHAFADLLDPTKIAQGHVFEDDPIASWAAKSWEL